VTIELQGDTISLIGACPAQDAETLAELLIKQRSRLVDASACTSLHGAVLQALIAFRPKLQSVPDDAATRLLFSQALLTID
jgi:hypothetical protein